MYSAASFVALLFVLAKAPSVLGIKCYVCHSGTDSNCASGNRTLLDAIPQTKMDCDDPTILAALKQSTPAIQKFDRCNKSIKDGETVRACFYAHPNMTDNGCKVKDGTTICLCTGDYCNSASKFYSTAAGHGSLMILLVYLLM